MHNTVYATICNAAAPIHIPQAMDKDQTSRDYDHVLRDSPDEMNST